MPRAHHPRTRRNMTLVLSMVLAGTSPLRTRWACARPGPLHRVISLLIFRWDVKPQGPPTTIKVISSSMPQAHS